MLWSHTKTFFVSNKHQTSRIVNFSYLPRLSCLRYVTTYLPSKAQAKDDRLSGHRINLIYTRLATFPSIKIFTRFAIFFGKIV